MCENTNQKMNMVGYVTDIDRLPKMSNAANLVSTIMGHAPTHERSRKAYPAKTAENWAPHLYAGRNHFWHVHELSIYLYIYMSVFKGRSPSSKYQSRFSKSHNGTA